VLLVAGVIAGGVMWIRIGKRMRGYAAGDGQ
jgi:hypothetical protein